MSNGERGHLKSAFRLFLNAAKAGDTGAQVNLGYFYDTELGMRPNRSAALYWYLRAYRQGEECAAANIGTIWRDEGKLDRAISWFQRAAKLGNGDAKVEIAKIYLRHQRDPSKATQYLKKACSAKPNEITEQSKEEATNLLKRIRRAGLHFS